MDSIQIIILCGAVYFTYTEKSKQNQKILLFVTGLLFICFVTQVEGIEEEVSDAQPERRPPVRYHVPVWVRVVLGFLVVGCILSFCVLGWLSYSSRNTTAARADMQSTGSYANYGQLEAPRGGFQDPSPMLRKIQGQG